jgi:hypothetical protein
MSSSVICLPVLVLSRSPNSSDRISWVLPCCKQKILFGQKASSLVQNFGQSPFTFILGYRSRQNTNPDHISIHSGSMRKNWSLVNLVRWESILPDVKNSRLWTPSPTHWRWYSCLGISLCDTVRGQSSIHKSRMAKSPCPASGTLNEHQNAPLCHLDTSAITLIGGICCSCVSLLDTVQNLKDNIWNMYKSNLSAQVFHKPQSLCDKD